MARAPRTSSRRKGDSRRRALDRWAAVSTTQPARAATTILTWRTSHPRVASGSSSTPWAACSRGSGRGPMLVVLDDLHWADPASLAVVEELLAQLPGCGSCCWRRIGPTGRMAGRAAAPTSSSTCGRCGPRTRADDGRDAGGGELSPTELADRVLERIGRQSAVPRDPAPRGARRSGRRPGASAAGDDPRDAPRPARRPPRYRRDARCSSRRLWAWSSRRARSRAVGRRRRQTDPALRDLQRAELVAQAERPHGSRSVTRSSTRSRMGVSC